MRKGESGMGEELRASEGLRLYNTMTRSVERFVPINPPKVGLYTCGPTVYNYAHIGNLRTYIFEDVLRRVLTFNGYDVKHVMNVTDVGHLVSDMDSGEDKMEVGARRENKSAWELAEFYFAAFRKDMARLSLKEPHIWCKATEHIPDQIEFIKKLEEKGYTYIIEDGVYFDTSKVPSYGKLVQLDREGLKAGARIDMVEGKRNVTDFVVWKFSPKDKQRQMEWDSPWGKGCPGWHIECSVMSIKYLGEQFDIHTGGVDHAPIHHTNEIAQSEAYTGKDWVKYWMHGEFLVLDKEQKMSKSKDNIITVDTLIEYGYDPLAYKYFCFNGHYRKQLVFSMEALEAASKAYTRLKSRIGEFKKYTDEHGQGKGSEEYMAKFREAINNDLNMPLALGIMWDLVNDAKVAPNDKYETLLIFDQIFGLDFYKVKYEEHDETEECNEVSQDILKMVEDRDTARRNKDFATADKIRKELAEKGYILIDTPQGTKIERRN